jgi:hypothetical protein
MRSKALFSLVGLLATLAAIPGSAQMGSPNTTPGSVTRVQQIRIKPGRSDAFWADMRQNSKPILDQEKQQGIITNYTVATKVTLNNENDWSVSVRVTYPNWAALDGLAAKTGPIMLAHYGSAAKQTEALMARIENAVITASFLVREQTVNPWK